MSGINSEDNFQYRDLSKIIVDKVKEIKSSRKERISSSIQILQEGDEDARWMAVGILGELGGEQAIKALITIVSTDSSPEIRRESLRVLADYSYEDGVRSAIIERKEGDEAAHVREEAAKIIAEMEAEDLNSTNTEVKLEGYGNKLKLYISHIGQRIREHIVALSFTPNLAGTTLTQGGGRLHRKEELIDFPELADFGYEPQIIVRTKLEDHTITMIFYTKAINPSPLDLILSVGGIEKLQRLSKGKQRAQFTFEYKEDQEYEIYIANTGNKGL
jgi:hypothetical protein